jgi:uncharacterized protein YdeI (YjbR/CyaY-like superfamily)
MVEERGKDGHQILAFDNGSAFEEWLETHHDTVPALWLRLAKQGNPVPSITYAEAVDAALCFGWVDGQALRCDDQWFLQRFTPRKARSIWSKINVDKVARLQASGRMRPSGLAAVERAKATGHWEAAYEGAAKTEVPPDLRAFLDLHADAAAFFESLNSSNRYGILFRLQTAVRPATRQQRFDKLTAMLLAGEKLYP